MLQQVATRLAGLTNGDDKPVTRRELESVKVPTWPTIATYRDWTTRLTRNVNTTANRLDDTAIGWLHEAFKAESLFDQFYTCPTEFVTLDRKLAKSLSEVIPKYLRDRITNKETAYHAKGQHINQGRRKVHQNGGGPRSTW